MKIAILGAAGVRTPLSCTIDGAPARPDWLIRVSVNGFDGERLNLIALLTEPLEKSDHLKFKLMRTTDARQALTGADFVITTFRVGGIASREIDERVPLDLGVLGQETTGPGGFAMGIRTIPVLRDYIHLMEEVCPYACLINFPQEPPHP